MIKFKELIAEENKKVKSLLVNEASELIAIEQIKNGDIYVDSDHSKHVINKIKKIRPFKDDKQFIEYELDLTNLKDKHDKSTLIKSKGQKIRIKRLDESDESAVVLPKVGDTIRITDRCATGFLTSGLVDFPDMSMIKVLVDTEWRVESVDIVPNYPTTLRITALNNRAPIRSEFGTIEFSARANEIA